MEEAAKRAFKIWDRNGDGKIDKAEWISKVSNNADIAHIDLHNLWDEHDKDKNGYLDQKEFGSMFVRMLEATEIEKQVKIFWTLVDRNKDGKLQAAEFEDMIVQLELDDDSTATLKSALTQGADKNGNIDYEHFADVMRKILE